jgi:Tfp pilus assembly protein PilV
MDKLMNKIQLRNSKGFSTVEILVAMVVMILTVTATIGLVFGSQSLVLDSETSSEALSIAQELIENAQADSRKDFALVNPKPEVAESVYVKKLEVETLPDFFTKKVISVVTWTGDRGKNQKVELTTLVTNPEGPNGGTTCNSVLEGDWKNPQMASYEMGKDLLVPSDPSSGFPIGDIDINNHKLYVVVSNSNGNNLPTFFKFDIPDPSLPPVFTSSMDNNPSVKFGLNAIHVAGNYAYVANAYPADYDTCSESLSCSQLQIIDLTSMTVESKLKMPAVTGDGGQAIGTSIFLKDNFIYLGLSKAGSGKEFHVIDVSDPLAPVWRGGYNIDHQVNSIYVRDEYAYVTHPASSSDPIPEELTILDISNPADPQRVGGYNAPDNQGHGKSMHLVGDTLHLGRTVTAPNEELYVLDGSDPETNLGPPLGMQEISSSVNALLVRDYLTFLITNDQFQVWNTAVPSSIFPWTPSGTTAEFLDLPGNGKGTTMDCEGGYIYFASLPSNDKGYIAVVSPGP